MVRCSSSFLIALAAARRARAQVSLCRYQISNPHQVVGSRRELEDPSNLLKAAVSQLSKATDVFQPAEYFFYSFSLLLADLVARMPRRSTVYRGSSASIALRNVRRHVSLTSFPDEVFSVIPLVTTHCHPARAADLYRELHARVSFSSAGRPRNDGFNRKPISILHKQVPRIAQFRFLAFAFSAQHRVWVGRGLMRLIRTFLAMKVDRCVPRIIRRSLIFIILVLKALQRCRRFNQSPVHREVFLAEQIVLPRSRQHLMGERSRYIALEQPLPILTKGGCVPYAIIHIQPDEPPIQKIVVELFHQLSLAPDAVKRLQQQRSQQLLGSNRWPADLRVELLQPRRKVNKNLVDHFAYWAKRMIFGHPLFGRDVGEHFVLVKVVSAHWFVRLRFWIEGLRHSTLKPIPGYLLFEQHC